MGLARILVGHSSGIISPRHIGLVFARSLSGQGACRAWPRHGQHALVLSVGPRARSISTSRSHSQAKRDDGTEAAPSSDQPSPPPSTTSSTSLLKAAVAKLDAERRLAELSARWTRFSGYDAIEQLKRTVLESEVRLNQSRVALDEAKRTYLNSVHLRSGSQKAINDLLARKSSWTDEDLSSYTSLLRSEHAQARGEADAQARYEQAERNVQIAFDELVRGVLRRYHEEQVWSDKVRNASTYATLIVAGLNILVFTLAILVVEPYKRRRLVQSFEERLTDRDTQHRASLQTALVDLDARNARAQEALTAGVQNGIERIAALADDVSRRPLASRLFQDLADEQRQIEWVITSALGAVAGIIATLLLTGNGRAAK